MDRTIKSIAEIEAITDLSDYTRVVFYEIDKSIYFHKEHLETVKTNFRERIKSIQIYFDNKIAYNILINLIDIFNYKIKQGRQPWSYKDMLKNMTWIVNILSDFNPEITTDIYRFACMIGNYKLIKVAFKSGINPNYIFEPITPASEHIKYHDFPCNGFYYVQTTMIHHNIMIQIYNLFLEFGFNIDNLLKPIEFIISQYGFYENNNLNRAISHNINLAELMFKSGASVNEKTLYILGGWIAFINPKKQHRKKQLKYIIDTIIEKSLEKFGTPDDDVLITLARKLIDYHKYPSSYKFATEWYILNRETILEYFIKKLLLNNVNININKISQFFIIYDNHEKKVYHNIMKMTKNIIMKREDAIKYVRDVSTYLLPDIANVVFDYSYTFRSNIHYNLASNI